MPCSICEKRRPKRQCPAVRGEICAICCGEGREETITCPLDCEYLIEAHKHEKAPELDLEKLPNRDITVTEESLVKNEGLFMAIIATLVEWATEIERAVDYDLRDALDALIRTYRTMSTGIVYESRPDNQVANGLFTAITETINKFRGAEAEQTGIHRTRDADVLELLVFLQRFELDRNNGRKRSRACLAALIGLYPGPGDPEAAEDSPLILP